MAHLSVLKLTTGETLFSETAVFEEIQDRIGLINPFVIKNVENGDVNTSSFYAAPWVPFTDHTRFFILKDMIALAAPLNNAYRRFYGITYLKSKLFELNGLASYRIQQGEDRDAVIQETFGMMDKEFEIITKKAGDLDFNMDGFKEYSLKHLQHVEVQSSSSFDLNEMFDMDEAELDKTKFH